MEQAAIETKGIIMVVEDDTNSLRLLSRILSENGYTVRPASSGTLALSSICLEAPDMILLDIILPDINGFEICKTLKAAESTREIPIIFISGQTGFSDKVSGFEAGCVDYISKPFQKDELIARVNNHIAIRRFQHQLQEKNDHLRHEISERLMMEEQLKKYQGKLEELVTERTAELYESEKRLRMAQKMEAIGTLAGGIAHDFNNLLTSIIGYTELALSDFSRGNNIQKNLNEIVNAGIRARDLVSQILTFSRQAEINRNPVQLSLLFKETLRFLRASLPTTVEIRQHCNEEDSMVVADPTQIHQILMNLCINAAQAMEKEGGVLEIQLDHIRIGENNQSKYDELTFGSYIRLRVEDNGIGIRPELTERIFEPFFTTKGRSEGTGMGLAVVHGIVMDMGGSISVSSEVGQGTVFEVLFRKYEGETDEVEKSKNWIFEGKGRILLVDDEKEVVDVMTRTLRNFGYDVTATTRSVDALDSFKSKPDDYDLVFTDMTMPELTGLELARRIRDIKPGIPIILCTGFSEGISPENIQDSGISRIVKKPMMAVELADAVKKTLTMGIRG